MDIVDRAEALIELDRREGVRRAGAALAGSGSQWCDNCGDVIEAARAAAMPSARLCLFCQEAAERHARGHRS